MDDLLRSSAERILEFESTFKAAVKLSLEQWALHRAGTLGEEPPFKRGHRVDLLQKAIEPLRGRLGKARFSRLAKALVVDLRARSTVGSQGYLGTGTGRDAGCRLLGGSLFGAGIAAGGGRCEARSPESSEWQATACDEKESCGRRSGLGNLRRREPWRTRRLKQTGGKTAIAHGRPNRRTHKMRRRTGKPAVRMA